MSRTNTVEDSKNIAVRVENLSKTFKTYSGKFNALDGVSFDINKGSFVVISGENGSGKSVLMSIIAGLEKPTSGIVYTSSDVGLILQDADASLLGDTPKDDVMFGLVSNKIKKKDAETSAENVLKRTGLYEKRDFPSHYLSGGEKRRLALSSILALGFDTIILDEPYSNLDYKGVKEVNSLIMSLLKDGVTIILLTHEIEKCLGRADKLIVLQSGRVVFDGSCKDALSKDLLKWGIKNPLLSYNSLSDLFWE